MARAKVDHRSQAGGPAGTRAGGGVAPSRRGLACWPALPWAALPWGASPWATLPWGPLPGAPVRWAELRADAAP